MKKLAVWGQIVPQLWLAVMPLSDFIQRAIVPYSGGRRLDALSM